MCHIRSVRADEIQSFDMTLAILALSPALKLMMEGKHVQRWGLCSETVNVGEHVNFML